MVRLYKKERAIVKRISRKTGFSQANVIRAAVLAYCLHPDTKEVTSYSGKLKAKFCLHCGVRLSDYNPV